MRQPPRPGDADTPLRLCYTGPAPARERQEEMERRFGLRIVVGYAMSESPYGLIWPHGSRPFGTLGTVRQHPGAGRDQPRPGGGRRRRGGRPGRHRRAAAAQPGADPGLLGHAGGDRAGASPPTAGCTPATWSPWIPGAPTRSWPGRRRCSAAAARTSRPAEVEEVLDEHPDVLECAVVGVPSELSEEEVKAFVVPVPGAAPGLRRAARVHRAAAGRVQGAAVLAADRASCRAPRRPGWPSTGCRPATRRGSRTLSPRRTAEPGAGAGGSARQRNPPGPALALNTEKQVEVAVRDVLVAAHRAGVAPAERGQHQAARVEVDDRGQVADVPRLVASSPGPTRRSGSCPRSGRSP